MLRGLNMHVLCTMAHTWCTFSPGVICMKMCSVCLKIHAPEKFWGGVLMVLLSVVCLLILFILMKEVKGEWLQIEDYLHYSCVITET